MSIMGLEFARGDRGFKKLLQLVALVSRMLVLFVVIINLFLSLCQGRLFEGSSKQIPLWTVQAE